MDAIPLRQKKQRLLDRRSRTIGSMLGGAVGEALGTPVALLDPTAIRDRYGKAGIFRMEPAYGRRGAITDHTRMTLFTAKGVILSRVRQEYALEDFAATALAIAGTILGACCGIDKIPEEWLAELELKDLIEETAMDLFDQVK